MSAHDHAHDHAFSPDADAGKLGAALALIVCSMAADVVVGVIGVNLVATWLLARPNRRSLNVEGALELLSLEVADGLTPPR